MTYELLDISGASLEAFASREMTVEAFLGMVKDDAHAAEEVAILKIDEEGNAVGRVEVEKYPEHLAS